MDVKKIVEKKYSFNELKKILEDKYKLKIIIDKSNEYYMISETYESDFKDKFVRQCTGVIINKASNKILHYFGEKAYESIDNQNNNFLNLEKSKIDYYYITPYIDGYIIKIFYYKNKWFFSTSMHTNIKYFNIKKNNNTLYNIFKDSILNMFETMDDFLYNLEYNYCYSFILNKENRKIEMLNKTNLKTLDIEININNYIKLKSYDFNTNYDRYILIEKDKTGKVINKIHSDFDTIKKVILVHS